MVEPTIRILEPGDEQALEAFLLPRLESSMFLLGNMRRAGLVDEGRNGEGTYAAAFDDGQIVAVAAHYWLGNIITQAPPNLLEAVVAAAVEASPRGVKGAIGPREQVDRVIEMLSLSTTGEVVQLDEKEGLYVLELEDLRVPNALTSGQVHGRRITSDDIDSILEMAVANRVELLREPDNEQTREAVRRRLSESANSGRTWLLEADGNPVAISSFNAALTEAVQIGGVYCPPPLRGRGYGRCAVAASLLDARAEGVGKAILFTGDENVPAIKTYAALGFRRIDDFRLLLLHEAI